MIWKFDFLARVRGLVETPFFHLMNPIFTKQLLSFTCHICPIRIVFWIENINGQLKHFETCVRFHFTNDHIHRIWFTIYAKKDHFLCKKKKPQKNAWRSFGLSAVYTSIQNIVATNIWLDPFSSNRIIQVGNSTKKDRNRVKLACEHDKHLNATDGTVRFSKCSHTERVSFQRYCCWLSVVAVRSLYYLPIWMHIQYALPHTYILGHTAGLRLAVFDLAHSLCVKITVCQKYELVLCNRAYGNTHTETGADKDTQRCAHCKPLPVAKRTSQHQICGKREEVTFLKMRRSLRQNIVPIPNNHMCIFTLVKYVQLLNTLFRATINWQLQPDYLNCIQNELKYDDCDRAIILCAVLANNNSIKRRNRREKERKKEKSYYCLFVCVNGSVLALIYFCRCI